MRKKQTIPVHSMEDWFAGIYVKPFSAVKPSVPGYEISSPHRHDFYYIVLLDKGQLELELDFEKVRLTDRMLFLSYPGQVHRMISGQMDRGWFLAFDPASIDEHLKNLLDQCLSEIILAPLSAEQSINFYSFIENIYKVHKDGDQQFRQKIIQSLVNAFAYQLAAIYLSMEQSELVRHPARSIEITKTFRQLVRRNFKSIKKPSEYAAKMNMTVSYLNDTVRSVTGFSLTYYIQQELMREAQRLLYHSDLPLKEIAGGLGIEDAQYFNRLFKKVGL